MCHDSLKCEKLFSDFNFKDIRSVSPPNEKGIYIIKIVKRGKPIDYILEKLISILECIDWNVVNNELKNRVMRLKNIDDCSIIYIGSAGSRNNSNQKLDGRYNDFGRRHTISILLWALLYFGWELDYGWKIVENSGNAESKIKLQYKNIHNDKLPAFVDR